MTLRLFNSRRSSSLASGCLLSTTSHTARTCPVAALLPLQPHQDEVTRMLSMMRQEALVKVMDGSKKLVMDTEAIQEGMGSFTSTPTVQPSGDTDAQCSFPDTSLEQFQTRCEKELSFLPRPLERRLASHTPGDSPGKEETVRVLSWNLLSQALGSQNDGFILCPPLALDWSSRRWRLLEELVRHSPDILCLQEVDHFPLLERALASLGYSGHFVPKPDSPCIYLPNNSGPDGCAVFYRTEQWEVVGEVRSRILEVWHVQSNQVVLAVNLRHRGTGREVCVATTHLKARSGALLATLRHEQGKDLLEWLETVRQDRPLVLTGDFNAEPSEPVIRAVTEQLESAYKNEDTEYTTWKVREQGGEQKSTLDYIFHSKGVEVTATLDMPTEEQVGADRLPSLAFPSDHLSLVADFLLL